MAGQKFKHHSDVPLWLWDICPNFSPITDPKLASPDTGEIYFDIESFQSLQGMRDQLGPLKLLSGYRSEVYNARVGGGSLSQHFLKIAFDIQIYPYEYRDVYHSALKNGFTGIGHYPSRGFIHVDRGDSRTWWPSQKDKRMFQELTQAPDIVV